MHGLDILPAIMIHAALGRVENLGVLLDLLRGCGAPFVVAGGFDAFDDLQAVFCEGFGGGAVGGVVGEGLEFVEGAAVEVDEG